MCREDLNEKMMFEERTDKGEVWRPDVEVTTCWHICSGYSEKGRAAEES